MPCLVTRTLRFAWLEYQDTRDGVALDRGLRGYGWRNLFVELAPMTASVNDVDFMDMAHHDLKIRYHGYGQTGLLATPTNDHAAFLSRWIVNPGVENMALTEKNTDVQADLLAISGHGANALVFGNAAGNENQLKVGKAFIQNAKMPTTGRLKYLLIPSCNNCHVRYDLAWATALTRSNPVHGVLGYSEAYPGDQSGANIMSKFARLLHEDCDKPILQAWKEANAFWSWSGVLRESCATQDTMARWNSSEGLPPPSGRVLHYNAATPSGAEVGSYPPAFNTRFVMFEGDSDKKPVEIDFLNNGDFGVGLIPGKRGQLVVRRNDGKSFAAGDVVRVAFARYRFDHLEMDLSRLLVFDGGAPVTPIPDGNKQKKPKTGKPDAIEIKVGASTTEIRIGYTIRADATTYYTKPEPDSPNHGLFVTRTFPPGAELDQFGTAFDSPDGAYLLPSKWA